MTGTAPSPKRDRYQIEALLIAHLNAASERHKKTAARFLNVTDGVPFHPPLDGSMLIKQTADANRKALAEYQIALKQFSDFVISGIVPEDFR